MPGAFDYSKWDHLDTESDSDSDGSADRHRSSAQAASLPPPPPETVAGPVADVEHMHATQRLLAYGSAQGMDREMIAETLAQAGGNPVGALAYLEEFLGQPYPSPADTGGVTAASTNSALADDAAPKVTPSTVPGPSL
eukprot:SAG31_NODE_10396_length_1143_cov_2.465517_1_plen_137_part_10